MKLKTLLLSLLFISCDYSTSIEYKQDIPISHGPLKGCSVHRFYLNQPYQQVVIAVKCPSSSSVSATYKTGKTTNYVTVIEEEGFTVNGEK